MRAAGGARIAYTSGDIFGMSGVLVHQCYCAWYSQRAAGLAMLVRLKLGAEPYPAAQQRAPFALGSVRVDHVAATRASGITHVVHVYAQQWPGKPGAFSPADDAPRRQDAFRAALRAVAAAAGDGYLAPTTVLFPANIGCGLAGGDWAAYHAMIAEFAALLPPAFAVKIVTLR